MKNVFKKPIIYLCLIALALLVFFAFQLDFQNNGYELVWADEFDNPGLPDENLWNYHVGDACELPCGCGWGNNELQYYTKAREKNARVEDGHLIIELHKEKIKNSDYSSARLASKADWKYGKIEIRTKIPEGLGVWSAIWMMPTENKYGSWPRSGEIDIMENVGYDPDTIVGASHTLKYNHSRGSHKTGRHYLPNSQEEFHTYILEWEESEYRLYIDDQMFFKFADDEKGYASWPFDQEFYLIMNIAYGGNWGGLKGIDPESLPVKMYIDYVRVYQK